jgi:hypothetical protein
MIRPNLHKKIANIKRKRFERECAKLDKLEEQSFADFGLFEDSSYFDVYEELTKNCKPTPPNRQGFGG